MRTKTVWCSREDIDPCVPIQGYHGIIYIFSTIIQETININIYYRGLTVSIENYLKVSQVMVEYGMLDIIDGQGRTL